MLSRAPRTGKPALDTAARTVMYSRPAREVPGGDHAEGRHKRDAGTVRHPVQRPHRFDPRQKRRVVRQIQRLDEVSVARERLGAKRPW